jgi:hypothetical protein
MEPTDVGWYLIEDELRGGRFDGRVLIDGSADPD